MYPSKISQGCLAFYLALIALLFNVTYIPAFALWLPGVIFG